MAESFFDNDHKDRVIEFDTSFRHIKDHEIDFKSPFGIQGLEYISKKILSKFIPMLKCISKLMTGLKKNQWL